MRVIGGGGLEVARYDNNGGWNKRGRLEELKAVVFLVENISFLCLFWLEIFQKIISGDVCKKESVLSVLVFISELNQKRSRKLVLKIMQSWKR